jgi:ubiquitin carboxyl-terminal hydrolase 7
VLLPPYYQHLLINFAEKKLDEEAAYRDARKKEREEQHLYLGIKVITDDTYRAYGGTDLTLFDQSHDIDPSAPRYYRFLRKSTVKDLAEKVGEDTGVDPRRLRFWCMVNRQNKTIRPDTPITEPHLTVEETHQRLAGTKVPELRLWCEMTDEVDSDGEPLWPTTPALPNGNIAPPKSDLIVLFLKWFDVERQTLKGVGHIYISKEKKVEELVPTILKKMGWPEKSHTGERHQLKLFEVSSSAPNHILLLKGT